MQVPIDAYSEEVQIFCSDGRKFAVPVIAMSEASSTIRNLINDAGIGEPITLPDVKGPIFAKVVEYCFHHYSETLSSKISQPLSASQDAIPMEVDDASDAIGKDKDESNAEGAEGQEGVEGQEGAKGQAGLTEKKAKGENEEAPDLGPLRDFSEWDRQFVKMDDETLFYLLAAANFLEIKPLVSLITKAVAAEILGMTPKQIWNRYKRVGKHEGDAPTGGGDEDEECPFTEAELEEVKKENTWMK